MPRLFIIIGSLSAFLGAFAAHALKDKLAPDLLNVWEVGVRYHLYHALALFAVAWVCNQWPSVNVAPAGWFFVGGTVIFSGTLYALSLTGAR